MKRGIFRMDITLNGKKTEIPDNEAVAELMERLSVKGPVAVLVNDQIVHRDKLAGHRLRSGDTVELLRMMGGG